MMQSSGMVCIDYLGHDIPLYNPTSKVQLKFEKWKMKIILKRNGCPIEPLRK